MLCILNFIWKGQDYKEGGLRMVDVRTYVDALKSHGYGDFWSRNIQAGHICAEESLLLTM